MDITQLVQLAEKLKDVPLQTAVYIAAFVIGGYLVYWLKANSWMLHIDNQRRQFAVTFMATKKASPKIVLDASNSGETVEGKKQSAFPAKKSGGKKSAPRRPKN